MIAAAGRRWRWIAVDLTLAAVLGALAFILSAGSLTWRVDRILYDAGLLAWKRKIAGDIVIVAIDDESLQAIGRWPWRRAVHATLLERIAAVRPKAVALDLLLSEADPDPTQDAVLRRALQRLGQVVVPVSPFFAPGSSPGELVPTQMLREAVTLAQADVELDGDGLLRHGFLRAGMGDAWRPHMALALMEVAGERPVRPLFTDSAPAAASDANVWRRDQRFLIRYAAPADHVPRIPYVQLLRGDVPVDVLAGKYVLIGLTATGLGDALPTPVSGLGRAMPGIEIIAQVLNSLRTGDTIRELSPVLVGVVSALSVLSLFTAAQTLTPWVAMVLVGGVSLAAVGVSFVLIGAGIWASPTAFVIAALLVYPLWSWRRLEHAVRGLDREIDLLSAEPDPVSPYVASADSSAPVFGDFLALRLRRVREATARLRRARRFLSDTLNALPVAVIVTGPDDRVLVANVRAATLLAADEPEALTGQPLARLLGRLVPAQAGDWGSLIDEVRASGEIAAEQARAKSGSSEHDDLLVHVARPPAADGVGPGLIVSIADVSALTLAEAQREEALAFVSHDLRSPAASILLLAEMSLRGALTTPMPELLSEFRRLAQRTLEISEEFVQVSRAESNPLDLESIDAFEVIDQAVEEVMPQALAKNVGVERPRPDGQACIEADRMLIERALVNLLNNAIKFGPADCPIAVGLARREAFWVVSVTDHGPGIDKADCERLFRKFQRLDAPASQRVTGIGLGLAFVEQAVRRHGGRVQVESTPGEGTRFEMWLPASNAESERDAR